ncbi:GNAT family N-acetyltransferase [Streptomyces sp. HNM0645]|uniref:GNAT family N-acetyltransferase n=1 Tax=Streptomyces sp. HNM0645 TaxID=2782343 RepID=UPI0024B71902|nr:GNAT family N-acetyltransferase [Streptomyces sp. HNM0645]MDI9886030.1 GNAT family N-acetyltransferase [Streptomyces sp. HNM0645]
MAAMNRRFLCGRTSAPTNGERRRNRYRPTVEVPAEGTGRFEITSASAAETRMIEAWAAREGWKLGDMDTFAYAVADPGALLIGRLDDVPIASVLAIRYGESFGFIGLYITRADLRGRGYGRRMWRAAAARLEGRLIGLDAVPAQQDRYMAMGLRPFWRNIHFRGVPRLAGVPPAGLELVDATTLPFSVLAAYDCRFFPVPRNAFLTAWVRMPDARSLAALHNGRMVGFGVSRPSGRTWSRIGPLYADSPEAAAAVLWSLAAAAPDRAAAIDAPEANPLAAVTMTRLGLEPGAHTVRMYDGTPPEVEHSGVYGTTSLEAS